MDENQLLEELIKAGEEQENITPKQAKIIQAAIEMFAEKGYAATSTNEIAKKAGVAEGTIFRHYKTKKELLIKIVTPVITKFAVPFFAQHFVNEIFKEKHESYDSFLRKILENRFAFVKQNVPLLKILLQELAYHDEIQERIKVVFGERVLPQFKKVTRHFQEQGKIVNYPEETILRMAMTVLIGFIVTRFIVLPNSDWDDELEMERTIEFIMNGLAVKDS